jgi:hypothetical protein
MLPGHAIADLLDFPAHTGPAVVSDLNAAGAFTRLDLDSPCTASDAALLLLAMLGATERGPTPYASMEVPKRC